MAVSAVAEDDHGLPCGICMDRANELCALHVDASSQGHENPVHAFCRACIDELFARDVPECPTCRAPIERLTTRWFAVPRDCVRPGDVSATMQGDTFVVLVEQEGDGSGRQDLPTVRAEFTITDLGHCEVNTSVFYGEADVLRAWWAVHKD